jgi:ParB-like chromosome segregation protein Spo0J
VKEKAKKTFATEQASLTDLKPHPRNYRTHSDDQLKHLIQSIKEHGFYRNVVVIKDGTILAGHGRFLESKA